MAVRTDVVATTTSGNAWIDGLLWGAHWSSGGGTTVIDAYVAGQAGAEWIDDGWGYRIYALPPLAGEGAAIAAAMQSFAEVCDIDIRTSASASRATLVWASVGNDDAFGAQAWSNPPGTGTVAGQAQGLIALNQTAYQTAGGPGFLDRGSLDHAVLLHQLGSALGLAQPYDTAGTAATFPGLTSSYDLGPQGLNQGIWTVMSYNDGWRTAPQGLSPTPQWGFQAGPMAFDIAALQFLYGANRTTRTGDDTYSLPGANQVGTAYACIWDAGGTDTILGAAALPNSIDLRSATLQDGPGAAGFVSLAAGIHGGLTIARGAVIENATGGALADRLTGNGAANHLRGLAGDDVLDGRGGIDTLEGGAGNDTYILADAGDIVLEAPGEGLDEVRSAQAHALAANVETLRLTGKATIDGTGNAGPNLIIGNAGANVLRGLGGNDVLAGGAGADRLEGGPGNDLYFQTMAGDTFVELAGEGVDELRSALSHTLGAHFENLTLTGPRAIDGTGNELANRLFGNAADNLLRGLDGNDVLAGYGGADRLEGGRGDDLYFLSDALDTLVEAPGEGTDEVRAALTHALGPNFERLVLTGAAAIDGTGNELANFIAGNGAANRLRGLDGADVLFGGGGADRLEGGAGADRLTGGPGDDAFLFLSPAEGGDLVLDFRNGPGDDDRIEVSAAGFGGGLAAGGPLAASRFQARADNLAQDADDRFVFRTTDATLWYDANGSAAGGLALIADLQAGASLTAADIYLVA